VPIVVLGQKLPAHCRKPAWTSRIQKAFASLVFLVQCLVLSLKRTGSSGITRSSHCFLTRGSTLISMRACPVGLAACSELLVGTAMHLLTQTALQPSGSGPSLDSQELLHFSVPMVSAGWPSATGTAKGLWGKLLPTLLPTFRPLCHIYPLHPFSEAVNGNIDSVY